MIIASIHMGTLISKYQETDFDETNIYTFNEDSTVEMCEFQTGDLIFFTDDFPESSIVRGIRRFRNCLWSGGGVVIYAPSVWHSEVLLLEFGKYSDDFLTDKLTLKNVGKGIRLVSLTDRLRRQDFEAIGIRKLLPRDVLRPHVDDQFDACNTLKDITNKEYTGDTFLCNVLKRLQIIKVDYAHLSLNAMSGSALRRYANYRKLEIFAFTSMEHERPKQKTFNIKV